MKKVKIMMTAIGILAVVGGALAFKANTFGQSFCTRTLGAGPGTCVTAKYVGKIDETGAGTIFYTTPVDPGTNCQTLTCPTSVRLTNIEGV